MPMDPYYDSLPPLGALHRQVGDMAAPHYGEPVPPHRRLRS
jgi:hypothetical protein